MDFLVGLAAFVGGVVLLVGGGQALVKGAVALALRMGVSPLLIGLTIVAWGTSAPELAFNVSAAWQAKTALVMGNVVGANICNLALVLGVGALIAPLRVDSVIIRREQPILIALVATVTVMAFVPVGAGPAFGGATGVLLLGIFLVYSAVAIRAGLKQHPRDQTLASEMERSEGDERETRTIAGVVYVLTGLLLLGVGGHLASDGATRIALAAGLDPRIVAVTVVSLGTTLPEMITGIVAIRKGQIDLAVGNAVGSCLFNLGFIFPIAALITPFEMPPEAGGSLVAMGLLAVVLVPICRTHKFHIAKVEGAFLLGLYALYLAYETFQAVRGTGTPPIQALVGE